MIGIFDSGLGGLTILKSILAYETAAPTCCLSKYNYLYLGDNARMPYGNKSQAEIYSYTKEAVDFLFSQGCKLIIIACNTASSEALKKIQQEYLPAKYPDKKVLGVIRPLVEEAVKFDKIKRVGVLGTRATIESGAYVRELHKLKPDWKIYQQAAPLLVPLIEEGWAKKPETKMILKKYLRPLKTKQAQILIPACTHYPFLFTEINRLMTNRCVVLNPGEIVAKSLADYLQRHLELNIRPAKNPTLKFYTTGGVDKFKESGNKFLNKEIKNIEKISFS
ncbi:MAG: glutamate racemase [Patescibacteria group bacterium]